MAVQCTAYTPVVAEQTAQAPRPEIVRKVQTIDKTIALTFDDGPSETYTPQVLRLLRRYHAKATFFVIGYRAKRYPNLILEELAEGHEVANHTARQTPERCLHATIHMDFQPNLILE